MRVRVTKTMGEPGHLCGKEGSVVEKYPYTGQYLVRIDDGEEWWLNWYDFKVTQADLTK